MTKTMNVAVLSAAYVAIWTVIPVLDKIALRAAEQQALTWTVFCLAFLLLTACTLFTDNAAENMSAALHSPWALSSGALTAAVYLAYFALLHERGVVYIVVLQPVIIVLQTAAGVVLFKDPLDRWNVAGGLVMLIGMAVYNATLIRAALEKPDEHADVVP